MNCSPSKQTLPAVKGSSQQWGALRLARPLPMRRRAPLFLCPRLHHRENIPSDLTVQDFVWIFQLYGTLKSFRLFEPGEEGMKDALVELDSVDRAIWLVEHLHGKCPLSLESGVSVHHVPKGDGGRLRYPDDGQCSCEAPAWDFNQSCS